MNHSFDWWGVVRAAVIGSAIGTVIWLAMVGASVVYLAWGGN
jgi:hypothetical protein